MDLFPLLKTALFLFSGITILFLLVSFLMYRVKNSGKTTHENLSGTDNPYLRYSQENVVHSIALPEVEAINYYRTLAPVESMVQRKTVPVLVSNRPRFEVVNSQNKADILLQFNYNPKLYR